MEEALRAASFGRMKFPGSTVRNKIPKIPPITDVLLQADQALQHLSSKFYDRIVIQ